MSLPLSVRQIRHALQQKVVKLLDLSDLSDDDADPDQSQVLTRALAALAIWEQTSCSMEEAAASVVDGGHDGGMDAIYSTAKPPRLLVVQSKWRNNGNATLNQEATLKLAKGFRNLVDNRPKAFNNRIKAKWDDIQRVLVDPTCKVVMIMALLGDDPVHSSQQDELTDIAHEHQARDRFEFRYLHLRDFKLMAKSGLSKDSIELEVKLVESFHRRGTSAQPEAYSGSVRARDVMDWYNRYGEKLFEQNIRGSLGNTAVNSKIRSTVQNDPELFWYLNKGIMMVANDINVSVAHSESGNGPARLALTGVSVVDGAQTVTMVHRILTDIRSTGLSGDAHIPVKIISLSNAPAALAERITVAANTQNAILQRDFAATDEVQEELHLDLDMIGKRYVYKRGAGLVFSGVDTCTIEDVALALVCQQSDPRLIGRVKNNPDTLWERESGGIYNILFRRTPNAQLVWNCVEFLRAIRSAMEKVASRRSGRAIAIAENANWLVTHILLRLLDEPVIKDSSETEWAEEMDRSSRACDKILDLIIHHLDRQYGAHAHPVAVFSDENRCKWIAGAVLADLRAGAEPPILQPSSRKRERAKNAVEYIIDGNLIPDGTPVFFRSHTKSRREMVSYWLEAHPDLGSATWVNNRSRPLRWGNEAKQYATSALAQDLIELITGIRPKSARGPDCWATLDGRTLTELAEEEKRRVADTAD